MLLPIRTGRFEGPGVFEIPVVFPPSRGDPADKWILDGSDDDGVKVVETPLATSLGLEQQARVGKVVMAVEPGVVATVTPTSFPWRVGSPSGEHLKRANASRKAGLDASRARVRETEQPVGWMRGMYEEPILSVRLTAKCSHDPAQWVRKDCGHVYCAVCDGHVCPQTKTVNRGPGPVIRCNRQFQALSRYEAKVCEHMSQDQSLAWVRAMGKPLPKGSIWIDHEDPFDKKGYEEIKKSIKARQVLYRQFSWPVAADTPEETKRRNRVVSLCEMIHAVGDCFSVVLDYPSRAADGPDFSRLQQVPGVYFLTFDGCKYGESTRHRQCMITNMSCLLWLSRDCDHVSHPQSRHGCLNKPKWAGVDKRDSLYSQWSGAFYRFLRAPNDNHCSHCAHLHGAPKERPPKVNMRKAVIEAFEQQGFKADRVDPEISFTLHREAILTVNFARNSVGARRDAVTTTVSEITKKFDECTDCAPPAPSMHDRGGGRTRQKSRFTRGYNGAQPCDEEMCPHPCPRRTPQACDQLCGKPKGHDEGPEADPRHECGSCGARWTDVALSKGESNCVESGLLSDSARARGASMSDIGPSHGQNTPKAETSNSKAGPPEGSAVPKGVPKASPPQVLLKGGMSVGEVSRPKDKPPDLPANAEAPLQPSQHGATSSSQQDLHSEDPTFCVSCGEKMVKIDVIEVASGRDGIYKCSKCGSTTRSHAHTPPDASRREELEKEARGSQG